MVKRGYKQPPSSPSPSPSHIMRTDVYLRVGNLTEPPHPPSTISSKITRVAFPGGNRHPSIPPVPSGTYVGPTVLPTRSDVTETTTKRSEKDESDEIGCPLGVLVEAERPEQQKPQFAAEEGGKWLINHSPTDESPQDFSPPYSSRTTSVSASFGLKPNDGTRLQAHIYACNAIRRIFTRRKLLQSPSAPSRHDPNV